ncbi:MAG: HAMP domain-containing histidine kinase [Lachnospiraceae bacterium]|nr:HAMP domain-containing histidine kinase [Lachnospiraceae bacterium]
MIGVVLGDEQSSLITDMNAFSKQFAQLSITDERWAPSAARMIFLSSYSTNAVLYYNGDVLVNSTPYEFDLDAGTPLGEKYESYALLEGDAFAISGYGITSYLAAVNGTTLLITYIESASGVFGSADEFGFLHYRDVTEIFRESRHLLHRGIAVALLLASVRVLVLTVIIRKLITPFYQLRDTAYVIADGHYGERIPMLESKMEEDEITEVALAFNRMADHVEEHVRELDELNEKQHLLLGALSHELKTPMTSIQGYAELLQRVKLTPERQASSLKYIEEESQRLSRLSVKMLRLLDLTDESAIEAHVIIVRELFAEAITAMQAKLDEKGIRLILEISEAVESRNLSAAKTENSSGTQTEELTIAGDEDLLLTLLTNLLDNAIKASPPGAIIRLIAAPDGIYVQDEGRGIAPEEQERILEPFYMTDNARSRREGGAGLGLALCAQIARLHGGQIVVQSAAGKGSRIGILWKQVSVKLL